MNIIKASEVNFLRLLGISACLLFINLQMVSSKLFHHGPMLLFRGKKGQEIISALLLLSIAWKTYDKLKRKQPQWNHHPTGWSHGHLWDHQHRWTPDADHHQWISPWMHHQADHHHHIMPSWNRRQDPYHIMLGWDHHKDLQQQPWDLQWESKIHNLHQLVPKWNSPKVSPHRPWLPSADFLKDRNEFDWDHLRHSALAMNRQSKQPFNFHERIGSFGHENHGGHKLVEHNEHDDHGSFDLSNHEDNEHLDHTDHEELR